MRPYGLRWQSEAATPLLIRRPSCLSRSPENFARRSQSGAAASLCHRSPCRAAAFTLVELMIVCAIIGAVLTIAIPTIYRHFHPASMVGTVRGLVEACSHARAHAILTGTTHELVIRPGDRSFSVSQAASGSSVSQVSGPERLESKSVSGEDWRMEERESSNVSSSGAGIFNGRIGENIRIEMLDVNLFEYKDAEVARVRFRPNGTCDEFTIILHGENDEYRRITLEVVTGLPDVTSDPTKWVK